MLRGEKVLLRARHEDDVAVLHADLHDDVVGWSRSDDGPWRPVPVSSSQYAPKPPADQVAIFTVVRASDDEIAGTALLWGIDMLSRLAHIGLSLRPAMRGGGLGTDVVRVLTRYGFRTLGLNRLALETLSDNAAMVAAAKRAGFQLEGTLRECAWVDGEFLDIVLYGLLKSEWVSR